MTTLTREQIDICNVKNRAEIDFLIAESEAIGGENSFEDFYSYSKKLLENLGKNKF